jgi:hypothetical protein
MHFWCDNEQCDNHILCSKDQYSWPSFHIIFVPKLVFPSPGESLANPVFNHREIRRHLYTTPYGEKQFLCDECHGMVQSGIVKL